MSKKPWSEFLNIRSKGFVRGMVSEALEVPEAELVDMVDYRYEERVAACGGVDPILVLVAYAQDELIYTPDGKMAPALNRQAYESLPRELRVNKFGLAYRTDAPLLLHYTLADIVIGAAIHLYLTQNWATVLYDGLRTVDGAYLLYRHAHASDMEGGLLSMPGRSAHNKGMAVDTMMIDLATDLEVDMGGHFDHLDMSTNGRLYNGMAITPEAKHNRLIREAAFLYAAFLQNRLVAPLRNEFWDDRLPENREDLWRVMESAARTIGITLLTGEDDRLYRHERHEFVRKWESWTYQNFLDIWQSFFKGHEAHLEDVIGFAMPPEYERMEFYHGNYNPIYDARLKPFGKNLTFME